MAEKRKGKKRKEEYVPPGEEVIAKPAKEEYTIAKWMQKNVPIKQTKFVNHNVKYFTASRAIDALLTSKWGKPSKPEADDALFRCRQDIVDYLHTMLEHKFFHRARKVPVSEQELRGSAASAKKKKDDKKKTESADEKTDKEGGNAQSGIGTSKGTDAESSVVECKVDTPVVEKEKRKRKIRLDMHNDQRFVDGLDAYVWIYDPIPFHYWIMGTFFVLGAIGLCLFPLWPPSVRLGVYYLSIAAAGFLVFIIFLVVLRLIIFCIVWIVTMGKHHIWILPNLTEDVGFLASFWPLYKYEYKGGDASCCKSKKKKKDKDSDAEDESKDTAPLLPKPEKISKQCSVEDDRFSENVGSENVAPTTQTPSPGAAVEPANASESESESSQPSSTGKDFEMVEDADLES